MSDLTPHGVVPSLGQTAVRPSWNSLPPPVRRSIAGRLGSPIQSVADQRGGFTPGVAARLTLDGDAVFIKAVLSDHPLGDAYRHEARTADQLPHAAPAPQLRWHDRIGDWFVLVFDAVAGRHPDLSPSLADIPHVIAAITAMSRVLTPCPVPLPPSAAGRGSWLHGWSDLLDDPPEDLTVWERDHLIELAQIERVWPTHADGATLVHGDIRPDNMLITPAEEVVIVDWAHASCGAAWQDTADLIPHMIMAGHDPCTVEKHLIGAPAWDTAHSETITSYAAAYAGYWARMSRKPAPAGVPHLRGYQRRASRAALAWLQARVS
ncbi:aminoglycoside phosphotransferase family protein (plasmid) [Nonomuraea sp. CA-143628]|uniref:aminoglycoside phosphotransferase family protein n=1 Tax=Nonomuraea sp. CA-143628 TaxID=3239997 RepID=UPI003D9052B6